MFRLTDRAEIQSAVSSAPVGMPVREQQGSVNKEASLFGMTGWALELRNPSRRSPAHRDDWGDQGTIGLFVKRLEVVSDSNRFGRFLGQLEVPERGTVFVIGVIVRNSDDPGAFEALECFATVDEMKHAWMLD